MSLLAVLALAAHATTAPVDSAELRGEDLMDALRRGGYTILLRHARTDRSVQEPQGTIPAERSAQRNLSAEGVRDAALMGAVLRKYHIPIGEIIASPMFRTRETAEYAAGAPTSIAMALRVFPSTPEQAALVAAAPKPGTNRLLVTHHFVIETHVPGIKPGDVGESEAAVVRPTGDGHVVLVGRITIADWERLGGVPAQASPAPSAAPVGATQAYAVPAQPVAIPDTPAGQLAARYIDAINSGDQARMRHFIETSLVPNPNRSTEERLQTFTKTHRDWAPLTVTGVQASAPDEITLRVAAKIGAVLLTAKAAPDQPGRATSITMTGTMPGGHP
jgi:phosphohistidine phosphatase SixA